MADFFTRLVEDYGAWAYVTVLVVVSLESLGIPMPGETVLITAALAAGSTHKLNILLVVACAATGGILGDNAGYWIGRTGGWRVVSKHGSKIRLDEKRLKIGRYLFEEYGGQLVFFGRFVALLRTFAAFLAGVNRMKAKRFLFANAAGGVVWASIFGFGFYFFADLAQKAEGWVKWVGGALALVAFVGAFFYLRRAEKRLAVRAEAAFPGPLEAVS
ncbi:MAG: dedA [Frankiales bacterium]|nr:dedA [Frankiales bacterium]